MYKSYRWLVCMGLTVFVLLPFVVLVMWSFSFRWIYPQLVPQWGWRSWLYVFSQKDTLAALWTTLTLSTNVTLLAAILGLPAAKVLGTQNFKGKTMVQIFIFLPAVVPAISLVTGIQGIFIRLGFTDNYLGVVLALLIPSMPYMIMGMAPVFGAFNLDYEDLGRTLGADRIRIFFHITLPQIAGGLMVCSIFTFTVVWSQYLLVVVVGGGRVKTLATQFFGMMSGSEYGITSAFTVIYIAPIILLYFVSQLNRFSNDKKIEEFS